MQTEFACDECRTRISIPRTVSTVTCRRCGETYFSESQRKFYPELSMYPITITGEFAAVSKWMPTHTRPVRPGIYECRFRTTEPHVLRLNWTGIRFVTVDDGQAVSLRDFLSWRGMLA